MDLQTNFSSSFADFSITNGDLTVDDPLNAAVLVSLFSDGRAKTDDKQNNKRGWWAEETIRTQTTNAFGSRLWLLEREVINPVLLERASRYAKEALTWLLDEGIAKTLKVVATRAGLENINLQIEIERNDGITRQFAFLWQRKIEQVALA
jgi:phage gp46-like protein